MNSVANLEKKIEHLNDEIQDIFHATNINLQALGVQCEQLNESKQTEATISICKKQLDNIQELLKQRNTLRLEYLITQQIKEEQSKVRRERLVQYQEKIYDQRRLITDKEIFYEGLLKPRKKRPAHLTYEEFQTVRRQEILMEERNNFKSMEDQIQQMKKIEDLMTKENSLLQKYVKQLEGQQISQAKISEIEQQIANVPTIYKNIKKLSTSNIKKEELEKLYNEIMALHSEQEEVYKQYLEEKQMQQYLKWENDKLREEYIKKSEEKIVVQGDIQKRILESQSLQKKYKRAESI